jgi:hypothetical protein
MKKKIFLSAAFVAFAFIGLAQVPDAFNYQAVVRNSSGEVVANQNVSFRISILQGSASGTVMYAETHTLVPTNAFGLVNLKIGDGALVSGVFSPGGWGATSHFLKVEIDPAGGSTYTHLGTSELLSVPYAFHAQTVQTDMVDDADANPTNELQTISLLGSDLTLSEGGGTVTLPAGGVADNWGTQTVESDATLSGNGTSGDPLGVVGDLTDDQTLSVAGQDLTISGGNTVTLPGDDWGLQAAASNATLSGDGTSGSPLGVVGDLTDDQTLSIVGNDLTISGGNTVPLPGDDWGVQTVVSNSTLSGNGTSGSPLGVVGDLTDDQTLSIVGNNLSISNGNTVAIPSIWSLNGNSAFYTGGNVGIGTSSPVNRLTIRGAGTTSYQSFHNSTTGALHSDGLLVGTFNSIAYFWNYENGPIRLATNNSERMIIHQNGYVGIGTSNPTSLLTLMGSSNTSYLRFFYSTSGTSSSDGLLVGNATSSAYVWNYENTPLQLATNNTARIVILANGNIGIGTGSPNAMLTVNGTASKPGGGFWSGFSDRRLKDLHGTYNKGLSEIMALQPVVFNYKADNPLDLPSDDEEIGFVAQEVREIFPEAVSVTNTGYLDLNLNAINMAFVNAIKELKVENDDLQEQVNELESRLAEIEKMLQQ